MKNYFSIGYRPVGPKSIRPTGHQSWGYGSVPWWQPQNSGHQTRCFLEDTVSWGEAGAEPRSAYTTVIPREPPLLLRVCKPEAPQATLPDKRGKRQTGLSLRTTRRLSTCYLQGPGRGGRRRTVSLTMTVLWGPGTRHPPPGPGDQGPSPKPGRQT